MFEAFKVRPHNARHKNERTDCKDGSNDGCELAHSRDSTSSIGLGLGCSACDG